MTTQIIDSRRLMELDRKAKRYEAAEADAAAMRDVIVAMRECWEGEDATGMAEALELAAKALSGDGGRSIGRRIAEMDGERTKLRESLEEMGHTVQRQRQRIAELEKLVPAGSQDPEPERPTTRRRR